MRLFLPDGKGIFRLWRKIPAGASPPPYIDRENRYTF